MLAAAEVRLVMDSLASGDACVREMSVRLLARQRGETRRLLREALRELRGGLEVRRIGTAEKRERADGRAFVRKLLRQ